MRRLFGLLVIVSILLIAMPVSAQDPTPGTDVAATTEMTTTVAAPGVTDMTTLERPAPPATKLRFAFIVKTMDNPYYTRMRDGAVDAAAQLSDYIDLEWMSAARQGDVEGQIRLMEDEIRKKVDLIILNPMGGVELIPAIEQANAAGIPVVINDTRSEGGQFLTFVGFENRPAAAQMAEYIVEYLGGKGAAKGKIAILEGFRGHSTAEDRLVGYRDVFDKEPGIEIVASMTGDWERSKGMSIAEDMLTSNPELKLVVGSNDEMGLGAVEAIVTAGKEGKVVTTGFDAICGALEEMANRDVMIATVDNHPDLQGFESVIAGYRHLVLKETLPPNIFVPGEIIRGDDPGLPELVKARCAAKE